MSLYAAIGFDLDGTLVDSWHDIAISTNIALAKVGRPEHPLEVVKTFIGDGVATLISRALGEDHAELHPDCVAAFREHYHKNHSIHTKPFPGVESVLKALHGSFPLFVITNKPHRYSVEMLEHLDLLRYFEEVVGGDSFPNRKPAPDGALHLAKTHGFEASRLLMIGDHRTDLDMSAAIGATSVFCSFGYGWIGEHQPTHRINHIDEVLELLR